MHDAVVIMFHSVGLTDHPWAYRHISEPLELFERKIGLLKKAGYGSVFFRELKSRSPQRKSVCLTFDDGYLDNWVHVFPVLEKYGMKATIFMTPEFADPGASVRRQAMPGSVTGQAHCAEACCAGFLSWPELAAMEKSGLVDVQSHGLSHTCYFSGPCIVDYWHPGAATAPDGPVWMLWNQFPQLKPYYLQRTEEHERKIPYGTPIYEYDNALNVRRYVPDPAVTEALQQYVTAHGNEKFFADGNWRGRLDMVQQHAENGSGTRETEEEYAARVTHELCESKRLIEQHLDKKVIAICWPRGGTNKAALNIARNAGYSLFTLPSAWLRDRQGPHYQDMIPRMASSAKNYRLFGRDLGKPAAREFLWQVERAGGSRIHHWLYRSALAVRLLVSYLK